MSYNLDGNAIPRPKEFKREFITVRQDHSSMDGKGTRDLTLVKERFTLAWETMSVANVAILLSILGKDIPVTFFIDEQDLTILATSVIVKMGDLEYSLPGSNYYASVTLELEEVQ